MFALKSQKHLSEYDLTPTPIILLTKDEIERRKNRKATPSILEEIDPYGSNNKLGFKNPNGEMFYFDNDSLLLIESYAYDLDEDLEDILMDDQEETMFDFSKDELTPYNLKYVHLEDDFRFSAKKSKVKKVKFYESNCCHPEVMVVKDKKSNSLGLFQTSTPSITQLIYDSIAVLPSKTLNDYTIGDLYFLRNAIEEIKNEPVDESKENFRLKRQQIRLKEVIANTDSSIYESSHYVMSKDGLSALYFNDSVQTALQFKEIAFHSTHQCIELVNNEGLMTLYFKDLKNYEEFNLEYTSALKNFGDYLAPIGPFTYLNEAKGYMRLSKLNRRTRETEKISPFRSYLVKDASGTSFYIGNNGLVFYDN